jgi:hypothetical protein
MKQAGRLRYQSSLPPYFPLVGARARALSRDFSMPITVRFMHHNRLMMDELISTSITRSAYLNARDPLTSYPGKGPLPPSRARTIAQAPEAIGRLQIKVLRHNQNFRLCEKDQKPDANQIDVSTE